MGRTAAAVPVAKASLAIGCMPAGALKNGVRALASCASVQVSVSC